MYKSKGNFITEENINFLITLPQSSSYSHQSVVVCVVTKTRR